MLLYINLDLNSIKILDDPDTTRTPAAFMAEFAGALAELDPARLVQVIFETERTPLPLIMYINKVQKERAKANQPVGIKVLHKEDSEVLRNGLRGFDIEYYKVEEEDAG